MKKQIVLIGLLILIPVAWAGFTQTQSLTGVTFSSHTWSDFDNDGDYDLVLVGYNGSDYIGKFYANYNSLLIDNTSFSIKGIRDGSVIWMDLNKDGFGDVITIGRNQSSLVANMYFGNTAGFTIDNTHALNTTYFNSVSIGDLNNDGYSDLVQVGCYNSNPDNATCSQKKVDVYLNNHTHLIANNSWKSTIVGVWKGSIALGDYNNDGTLDLALSGTTTDGYAGAITKIYDNNGTQFNENTNITLPGIFFGSLAWSDYDNDGDLDLAVSGAPATNNSVYTAIYKNDASLYNNNSQPVPPTELNITFDGARYTLTWNNGSDSETPARGLYYNLRVGLNTTTVADKVMSSAFPTSSNPPQGYFGNMMQGQTKYLYIPQQCLFAQVQSIDTGMRQSNFSEWVNHSSAEICNAYDNDCDFLVDEGLDANNNGSIDTNETYDRDGDGFFPYNSTLLNYTTNTSIFFSCTNYEDYDCDDNSNSSYPGAACEKAGIQQGTGVFQWNQETLQCDCEGTPDNFGTRSGAGGSTPSSTSAPATNQPAAPVAPTIETPQLSPPEQASGSATTDVVSAITSTRYKYVREAIKTGTETKIIETIRAFDIEGIEDVSIQVTIPKYIAEDAQEILPVDDFKVIEQDPVIGFYLGNIAPFKSKTVQYIIAKPLSDVDIKNIAAEITVKDNAESQELLEEQIQETQKVLNITQDITVDLENNETVFKININYTDPTTVVGDVYIYTEIPKCLIEIIKEDLIESDLDFEIVNEDPLIVWHFDSLLDVKEINYKIKAVSDEDCANKAQAVAVAKKIIQVQLSPDKNNIFLALGFIPLVIIILSLFTYFGRELEHINPEVQRLISYVKHHYRHGFGTAHLRQKLRDEGYHTTAIAEALKLNSRNKLHYYIQRFEIGFEEMVLTILIALSVLDATKLLPGDYDFIQKIISWTLASFMLYHISITKLIFGTRKRLIDLGLILSFFLLIMKEVVGFANTSIFEALNQHALVVDLYAFIIQHNQLFEIYLFLAGVISVSTISLYMAFTEEVKAPSFLSIVHFHPTRSWNPLKISARFIITEITLLAFFVTIFNLMMEWLAIIIDSLVIVIAVFALSILIIKHRHKLVGQKVLLEVTDSGEKVYEKFLSLFHYKRTILLALSGLLIFHLITELAIFMIPYLTGLNDALYFGNFFENHNPLFSIISESPGLFSTQAAGLAFSAQALLLVGYALNALAVLYLILLPTYLWYHMFKHRALPLHMIPKVNLGYAHEFFSMTSIVFLLLNPAFSMMSIRAQGLVGVDIQTNMLNLSFIPAALSIAICAGLAALVLAKHHTRAVQKTILTISLGVFMYYIYLFFRNTVEYYLSSIVSLAAEQLVITITLAIFLVITIAFYTVGLFAYFVELYLRRELWFENHTIHWIERIVGHNHHAFHFIHHHDAHKDHLHGAKEAVLEHYIKRALLHGQQIHSIEDHLFEHGWPHELVKEAEKEVLKDKTIMHFIRNIHKVHHAV